MAEQPNAVTTPTPPPSDPAALEEAVAAVNDPGGAHRKGHAATTRPARPVPAQDPVPLVPDDEVQAHAQKPDQSQATPGSTSTGYSPNHRVLGADR